MSDEQQETLLEFPCDFPIKIMGADETAMIASLTGALQTHAPDSAGAELVKRPSAKGNYLSITVTIVATSKPQLDSIYEMLTASEAVLVAL